jgi:hypothetical protein
VVVLQHLGLNGDSTVVDIEAGTGQVVLSADNGEIK